MIQTKDPRSAAHLVADRSLQRARADLDDVMRTLPDHDGDDTMATPALLGLLLNAVAARRHLTALETALEPGATLEHGSVPSHPGSSVRARDPWP